jgi:Cu2+-exporting ATPase
MALAEWSGPDWARPLVLALEAGSSHPIAAGFRRAWREVEPAHAVESVHVAGGGIEGTADDRRVAVGSPAFVRARARGGGRTALPDDPTLTPVLVAVDGEVVGACGFGDPVRDDARRAVARLGALGWRVGILSGDDPRVVATVAARLDLPPSECAGSASPEEKLRVVEAARRRGESVVMVGDGVNDAAAIAAASVGVGVHGGAEACLTTADVYLLTPGLESLVRLVEGASRTMRVIRRNIAFSLIYNVAGASLAMAGVLDPLIAAILMPASSLTVVLASWRGRTFRECTT